MNPLTRALKDQDWVACLALLRAFKGLKKDFKGLKQLVVETF